jgi:large subunit ribosomal protein L22
MKEEYIAKVIGRDLPISTKQSIEICNFIRGKNLQKSKELLQRVIEKEIAIPFKRFNKDMGHKRNIASGRYPKKSCNHIIKLLNSAESNAQDKGLNTATLFIKEIIVNRASKPLHYGRKGSREMKRTHIKIVVEEKETKNPKEEAKKGTQKK